MAKLVSLLLKADAFWRKLGFGLTVVAGIVLIVMMLSVVLDVSGRYIFNHPIKGAVEALELAMPFVIFFGLAYALVAGSHVRVTLLFDKLPPKPRLWVDIVCSLVSMIFLVVLVYWGWGFFWQSFVRNEQMYASVDLPWWLGKFALPLGFSAFLVQFLIRLFMNIGYLTGAIKSDGASEHVAAKVET